MTQSATGVNRRGTPEFGLRTIAAVCLGSALATAAHAQTNGWTNAVSGKWETPGNWSLNVAPTSTHSAVLITNASSKTVMIDATTTNFPGTLTISNLTVSAPGTDVNALHLTDAGTATPLHILNGVALGNNGVLLLTNSALQVDGVSGDAFTVDGSVTSHDGFLQASKNVIVGSVAGSAGTWSLVGGTNLFSAILAVGNAANATGTIWVTDGRLVVTNTNLIIGNPPSGVGWMTVSNSTVLAKQIQLGANGGSGALTLAGSTNDISGNLDIGRFASSTGIVLVTGGQLFVTNGVLTVGLGGFGQMTVSNGTVSSAEMTVADLAASQGIFTLAGGTNKTSSFEAGSVFGATGSVFIASGLMETKFTAVLGNGGVGEVTLAGGTFTATGFEMGRLLFSRGTLTVAGALAQAQLGNFLLPDQLVIGRAGTASITVSNGTLQLPRMTCGGEATGTGSVLVTAGTLVVTNGPTILGSNGVGQATISGGTVAFDKLTLGQEVGARGSLTISGGTNRLSSTLDIVRGAAWIGGGSTFLTNSFNPGLIVRDQMTISNGTVISSSTTIGLAATGTGGRGVLTVAGGTLSLTDGFTVGANMANTGMVWVTGGSLVGANFMTIGGNGVGEMTVSNGTWRTTNVFVGSFVNGRGSLTIAGGTNIINGFLIIGHPACTSTGSVVVAGGQLSVTNDTATAALEVHSGNFNMSGGMVQVDNLIITNSCGQFQRSGGTLHIGQLILDPLLDADGDGLRNDWEQQYGLDPLVAIGNDGPAGDPDGDGVSNLDEQAAGTDPVEFRVTAIIREGDNIRVTWTTFGDNTYFVQTNSAPDAAGFADVNLPFVIPFGAAASTTNYLDIGGALFTNRHYRIRQP